MMMRFAPLAGLIMTIAFGCRGTAEAETFVDHAVPPDGRPPFTATLSNHVPLVFGMNIEETSRALGQPLQYVGGPPRREIYLALRNLGGSGLIDHHDRLFLQ